MKTGRRSMVNTITVRAGHGLARINPNLYGHFVEHLGDCVYGGIWVGEDSSVPNERGIRRDVVEAIRGIEPPVIRWPGGCFADDYHWRDGIGPREERPTRVNIHWGMEPEDNQFGTHEFMDFCRMVGAQPYVCGNVGTGTVREMRDWLEYLNHDGDSTLTRERGRNGHLAPFEVRYFGIGNESWGCGGGMCPEHYAHQVRRFSTFLPFGGEQLNRIACGPNGNDTGWTRDFFKVLSGNRGSRSRLDFISGFSIHYYCGTAGSSTEYSEEQWYELLAEAVRIESIIDEQRAILDEYDPQRRINLVVDEWGTWHLPDEGSSLLRQQNTIRDALVAALTLDIFNRKSNVVKMANIAQMTNVLQSPILTEGSHMLRTPTYHVFEMYSAHQGGESVPLSFDVNEAEGGSKDISSGLPVLAGSCSRKDGRYILSVVNTEARDWVPVRVVFQGAKSPELEEWRVLCSGDIHDHNTFEKPDLVRPGSMDLGEDILNLPPASVSVLRFGPPSSL